MDPIRFTAFVPLAFSLVFILIAYFYGWRSMHKKDRCTEKTTGKVVSYSLAEYNGFHLPVVQYEAGGKKYKVVGPNFKAAVTKTVTMPLEEFEAQQKANVPDIENLPDVMHVTRVRNGFITVTRSPIYGLFPEGKEVDVYYNPKKPKEAYVIRYAAPYKFVSFWMMIIFAVIFAAAGIVLLTIPM
ncbi:MAG: DUF3592 domain-containing protein [Clostridia bacterium]|nr:DUF3592 domain-containing protein [Clostridia bacterium]